MGYLLDILTFINDIVFSTYPFHLRNVHAAFSFFLIINTFDSFYTRIYINEPNVINIKGNVHRQTSRVCLKPWLIKAPSATCKKQLDPRVVVSFIRMVVNVICYVSRRSYSRLPKALLVFLDIL